MAFLKGNRSLSVSRHRVLGVILLLTGLSGLAGAERLPVRIFTSADGLGSSFVDYLYRDSRGFMWFCTRDGLSRFDGSRFVTYRVGDGKEYSPGVETVYEARDGSYFISTTIGTFRFDPNQLTQPNVSSPRLTGEFVAGDRGGFFEDGRGNMWVSTGSTLGRLVRSDGRWSVEAVDLQLPGEHKTGLVVASIAETQDGSLWLDTSWGLVRRLPWGGSVLYADEAAISGGNSTMFADKNGRIWMTRRNRILVLRPEPLDALDRTAATTTRPLAPTSTVPLLPEGGVQLPRVGGEIYELTDGPGGSFVKDWFAKYAVQTSDGDIWITAENNLLQISNGVFHLHSAAEGLPKVMGRMAEDNAGNLWIGGQTGLARLDRNGLVTLGTADGLASPRVFAINESKEGDLFFGGSTFAISRFDGHRFETVRPGVPANSSFLWTSRVAYRSSVGEWWILTNDKLYRFPARTNLAELDKAAPAKVYGEADGLVSDQIYQLFEDSAGDVWVSTRGAGGIGTGVARLAKGAERFKVVTEADGLPKAHAFSSAVEDTYGNIWMGFYEGGLARFDGERFSFFSTESGLPTGLLTDLHVDAKGRLWIGSAVAGLYRLDDTSSQSPSFVHMTTADGLSSENVRTITEDALGRIYLGTVRGVDRLSPDTGRVKHYSVSDGLASDFIVDSHRDARGDLWFATNDGVSRLRPLPDERVPPPRIFVGAVRVAGVEQPISQLGAVEFDSGDVGYTDNNLQIDYFGLDFRAGESIRFQYKLEGAGTDWSTPTDERTITFANLSPASYRFLVRAVNSEGSVSEVPALVSMRILPPLWQRWWFVLSAALLLIFAVLTLYRYRLKQLHRVNAALAEARDAEEKLRVSREERLAELEKVRARIATDLHDDIGASLTQIAVLSEVARARSGNGNGGRPDPLKKITEVSNELVGTMSDIVWSINPAKDHLSDLTQRMRRFAADLLTAKGVAFKFRAPESAADVVLNSNIRREVFLIFKESLNNVVKHAGAGFVEIEILVDRAEMSLTIADDGIGIDATEKATPTGGHGLQSMQKRARELDGDLWLSSDSGRGTTVRLRLPLDRLHSTSI